MNLPDNIIDYTTAFSNVLRERIELVDLQGKLKVSAEEYANLPENFTDADVANVITKRLTMKDLETIARVVNDRIDHIDDLRVINDD